MILLSPNCSYHTHSSHMRYDNTGKSTKTQYRSPAIEEEPLRLDDNTAVRYSISPTRLHSKNHPKPPRKTPSLTSSHIQLHPPYINTVLCRSRPSILTTKPTHPPRFLRAHRRPLPGPNNDIKRSKRKHIHKNKISSPPATHTPTPSTTQTDARLLK
jgi:hypothetical protein